MLKNKKRYLGIIIAAVIMAGSIYFAAGNFSEQGAYVEVKGLSEKIVKADTAIWSIEFRVTSNNIDEMYNKVENNIRKIKTFLIRAGFEDKEISVAPLNIYENTYRDAIYRFNATVNMSVYTNKVDLAKKTSQNMRILMKDNVVISGGYLEFKFTDLNSIKPEMLTEATKKAQEAANGFANNSGVKIGKIVRGKQGLFSIYDKDPGAPEYKRVRVISTLRYLLK